MAWSDAVNGDPLAWLLEPEMPGVRYLALRDLQDPAPSQDELDEARELAHREGPIAAILEAMNPEGYWVGPGPGYNPKYRSTVWAVIMLAQLGASPDQEERVVQA